MFLSGVLDGILGNKRHFDISRRQQDILSDQIHETDMLLRWLMDIDDVLAGRLRPDWIGPAPREITQWRKTFDAGYRHDTKET
jgi:hypothetical protein